jgi:hypothetical protein
VTDLNRFQTEELSALLFTLDIAGTVQPLVPEAEQIRREMIDELLQSAACLSSLRSS